MGNRIEITRRNERLFGFAKRMAELSSYGKFRHGAVLVHHGVVLNASHNKDKPCSFGSRFRCRSKGQATLHAELGAILNMPRESTEGSDIYVVRVNYENQYRTSKHCPMCQEAMRFCGVKRVFYSTEYGHFEMMKL